jgi:hypothetical protein
MRPRNRNELEARNRSPPFLLCLVRGKGEVANLWTQSYVSPSETLFSHVKMNTHPSIHLTFGALFDGAVISTMYVSSLLLHA